MSNSLKGSLYGLSAAGLFSLTAVMGKYASADFHVLQILFFRQLIVFLSVVPFLLKDFPAVLKTENPTAHAVRLFGAFSALALNLWAVSVLPLTTAVVLMFSQAFIVAVLAHWYLGEEIGWQRLAIILVGFIGVVIVARPDVSTLTGLYPLIAIGAALGAGVALVCVRKLAQKESTATLLSYQAVFVGLFAGVPMLWLWKTPDYFELLFLLSMGVVATLGQWVGVKALRYGEANVISGLKYTEFVYAALFGFWFFGEIPDNYTLLGALLIIFSGLAMIHRQVVVKRGQAAA